MRSIIRAAEGGDTVAGRPEQGRANDFAKRRSVLDRPSKEACSALPAGVCKLARRRILLDRWTAGCICIGARRGSEFAPGRRPRRLAVESVVHRHHREDLFQSGDAGGDFLRA
jgi:hypothetical protein